MQKLIRVTAIIALALLCLSLLLLLVSLPFQQVIAHKLYSTSPDVISLLPIFPLQSFINCFLLTGCAILAVVFGGNQKGGLWLEILVLAAVILVIPFIAGFWDGLLTPMLVNARGSIYVAANATARNIANWCMAPGNLGRCLMLVVCGMSIVYKRMSKKPAKAVE